jgi:hypothetical protein
MGSGVGYIFQYNLWVKTEPFCDIDYSFRPKGAFGVNVHSFSFSTTFVFG